MKKSALFSLILLVSFFAYTLLIGSYPNMSSGSGLPCSHALDSGIRIFVDHGVNVLIEHSTKNALIAECSDNEFENSYDTLRLHKVKGRTYYTTEHQIPEFPYPNPHMIGSIDGYIDYTIQLTDLTNFNISLSTLSFKNFNKKSVSFYCESGAIDVQYCTFDTLHIEISNTGWPFYVRLRDSTFIKHLEINAHGAEAYFCTSDCSIGSAKLSNIDLKKFRFMVNMNCFADPTKLFINGRSFMP